MNKSKVLYIYPGGRKLRLDRWANKVETPKEFLFGYPNLVEEGVELDFKELDQLSNKVNKTLVFKLLQKINLRRSDRIRLTSSSHFLLNSIREFNKYKLIVASNEYIAFGLQDFKTRNFLLPLRGKLKTPFVFFVMGMLANVAKHSNDQKRFKEAINYYRGLLDSAHHAFFLGLGEYKFAIEHFVSYKKKMTFLPYCIDTNFWRPSSAVSEDYVLFIGNDVNRDFRLLIQTAEELDTTKFKFVTKKIQSTDLPENVELIKGDWKENTLSDVDIRELYQKCALVILPLKESLQPSGQSVCLQAMACGKPVMISKTEGFWDPETFIDTNNILFVHEPSVIKWSKSILEALNNKEKLNSIGRKSRELVEDNYHLRKFSEALQDKVKDFQ